MIRRALGWQVLSMAVLSVGWLAVAVLQKGVEGQPVTSLWDGYTDPLAWLVLLWPAVGQYSSGEISAVAAQSRCAAAHGFCHSEHSSMLCACIAAYCTGAHAKCSSVVGWMYVSGMAGSWG